MRELENVIERAMILCPNDIIARRGFAEGFKSNVDNALHLDGIPPVPSSTKPWRWLKKKMIERALKMANNVQSHAADILGIGKSGLNQKIREVQPGGGPEALSGFGQSLCPKGRSAGLQSTDQNSLHFLS